MSDAILSARELHKSYDLGRRKVEVLHGVSLEIASGEFLSLQGASGAGKSTLLHLLGGLDEPSAGEVFAGDQSLFSMGASRLAKWRNCVRSDLCFNRTIFCRSSTRWRTSSSRREWRTRASASRSGGAGNCWSESAWPSACTICRPSCPAASNNA